MTRDLMAAALAAGLCAALVGGCPGTGGVEGPVGGEAVIAVEGNLLDYLSGRGAAGAEVQVTVHVDGARFVGTGRSMSSGHFVVRAAGSALGAAAGGREVERVELAIRSPRHLDKEQHLPGFMVGRTGDVLVLPDVYLRRRAMRGPP